MGDDLAGQHRPELADDARAEEGGHVLPRGRWLDGRLGGDELRAVLRVRLPAAGGDQALAGLAVGERADHRHRLAPPADAHLEHGEAGLRVAHRHPLDAPLQRLPLAAGPARLRPPVHLARRVAHPPPLRTIVPTAHGADRRDSDARSRKRGVRKPAPPRQRPAVWI